MQYLLNTNSAGALTLTRSPSHMPPLGLLLPAKQDTTHTVAAATTLDSLITSADPALPDGLELHASAGLFVHAGGIWLNQVDESDASTTEVSGVITLRNNATHDIGITW